MTSDHSSLRAGDTDRDRVAGVLNTAYAEGRITRDELDERLTATWSARTFGDLEPLTADLVAPVTHVQPSTWSAPTTRPVGSQLARTGTVTVDTSVQHASVDQVVRFLGDHKREGSWRLAPRSEVKAILSDVTFDLREAVLESRECVVDVQVFLGTVTFKVPAGLRVESTVGALLSDDKVQGMVPVDPGAPRLLITGFCLLGDVKVQGPEFRSLGQKLGLTK